jgi:hypothetical protein
MGNHEERFLADSVYLLMGFKRTKDSENGSAKCIRKVIKHYEQDLEVFKAQLTILGGHWRIHKTVNARDCAKARKVLMHTLIDFPEKASYIDSLWRTALLQRECIYGEKKFMFDIDTIDVVEQEKIVDTILCEDGEILEKVITPSGGRHIVTRPFDCRAVCELPNVELLRDGYIYVCSVGV